MLLWRQVARRIILVVPTLIGVLFVSFMLAHLSGDPTDQILPVDATEAARTAFRAEYGLDRPLPAQLAAFTGRVLRGDFGRSLRFSEPATRLVFDRLSATLELALVTLAIAVVIGVPAGVASSRKPGGTLDGLVRGLSALTQALAPFYVGVVAILVFAVWLHLLPTGGRNEWNSVVLPASTLALTMVGLIAQMTRACMLDTLRADYVRTARAKGLVERLVVWKHAFRNAVMPILTLIGLQAGTLMGGVVVTETVFAWPGIGRLAIQAIYARDFPVVQATVFFAAVVFVTINLLVDIVQTLLDPRLRTSEPG
jgi:peptide/nickel transport system permease protein